MESMANTLPAIASAPPERATVEMTFSDFGAPCQSPLRPHATSSRPAVLRQSLARLGQCPARCLGELTASKSWYRPPFSRGNLSEADGALWHSHYHERSWATERGARS